MPGKRGDGMNTQQAAPEALEPQIMRSGSATDRASDEGLLLAAARSGHFGAFEELYKRHQSVVYRTALRMLGNEHDAEDAVQRSFLQAFKSLVRFRGDSKFGTWITRIAINEALMLLRQRRSARALPEVSRAGTDSTPVLNMPDDGPTPEETLAQTELRIAMIQAISSLRSKLRIVVLLRELHGLTTAETARCLGLTVSSVKARNHHAKRHLRQRFEREHAAVVSSVLKGPRSKQR
jgi:RNA polymerase sigma-70 factor (ECF subfamily)